MVVVLHKRAEFSLKVVYGDSMGTKSDLLAGLLLMGLSACEKGPAEKAGAAIDDAASKVAVQF